MCIFLEYDATSINMSSQPSATKSQQKSASAHPSNQSVVKNIPPLNLNIDLSTGNRSTSHQIANLTPLLKSNHFQPQPHRINRPEEQSGKFNANGRTLFCQHQHSTLDPCGATSWKWSDHKAGRRRNREVSMSNHFSNQAQQSTPLPKPKCPPPP
uniref:Uncharacterized protein n=1 Tax=Ditylenchus dipsaci TaxID=166011 RepID=A0A915E168_9BILA